MRKIICPQCGEDEDSIIYISQGIHDKGIFKGIVKIKDNAIFKNTNDWKSLIFICKTCGKEWDEPWELV